MKPCVPAHEPAPADTAGAGMRFVLGIGRLRGGVARARADRRRQVVERDLGARRERDRLLDRVPELADVARPLVRAARRTTCVTVCGAGA